MNFNPKMEYNKLIRDKIPEIIKNNNKIPLIHIADDLEYWKKLKQKLNEEINEFLESEKTEELADILEVIKAITEFKKNRQELEKIKLKKAIKKGKFKNKIILEKVE